MVLPGVMSNARDLSEDHRMHHYSVWNLSSTNGVIMGRKRKEYVRTFIYHINVEEIMKLVEMEMQILQIPDTPINRAKFIGGVRTQWLENPNSELGLVLKLMSETIRSERLKNEGRTYGTTAGTPAARRKTAVKR